MKFTILGGFGFIGRHIADYLDGLGLSYLRPGRGDTSFIEQPMGHVIYCAGVTSDFRHRPFDTIRAHVCDLVDIVEGGNFDSLLYLSSTRVYARSAVGSESSLLSVDPADSGDLYNLSKLMGESVCLSSPGGNVRVARLSNVVGKGAEESGDFLPSLIESTLVGRTIHLETSLESEKDYIDVGDVVPVLYHIATRGDGRIYNVASGRNTTNRQLVDILTKAVGECKVSVAPQARCVRFPKIDISAIRQEFGFVARPLSEVVASLVPRQNVVGGY